MSERMFVSGNDAVAFGVRLARPQVIAAYPITPQTIVVERLSDFVEDGSLDCQYMHVESEHSAISAVMGASAIGARTFTASSSQGLLYMAEGLHYASGGRFPIVMMNACRSVALPWSIFGDQRDSLSLLDSGWLQVYVEDAQEALDMVLQSFKIAENAKVLTPIMVNLDGFLLTHTYELLEVPDQALVDKFLPPFTTPNKMSTAEPKNLGFSTSPADNLEFKYQQHQAAMDSIPVIKETAKEFTEQFGRNYGGLVEEYCCEDAELILISLGSVTGTVRVVVDQLRSEGIKAGLCKIRFMRPFPLDEIAALAKDNRVIGVLDKDISFGYEGTVFTNVNSALVHSGRAVKSQNFIAGLGGRDISQTDIRNMFASMAETLKGNSQPRVQFVNMGVKVDE